VRSVVTQTPTLPSQYKRIDSAKALLASLNLNPLEHHTRSLNSWDDAEELGCSVLEYADDPKAGDDAKAVFQEFLGGLPNE
jgi:chromosome partitioning protein